MSSPFAVDTVPSEIERRRRWCTDVRPPPREATQEVEVSPLWQQTNTPQHSFSLSEASSGDVVMSETTSEHLSDFQVAILTRTSFAPKSYDDDDDDSSQNSAFYDSKDFQTETWTSVVYHNYTTGVAGIALVATAAVCVHPLVLLAGAATAVWAVGSVHAIQQGYEFFSDGSFSRLFWSDPPAVETYEEVMACAKEEAQRLGDKSLENEVALSETTASTVSSDEDRATPRDESLHRFSGETTAATVDEPLALNSQWIHQHFPPLQKEVVHKVEFPGLNAQEFFYVFFSDDAPYSFMEFQKKRGDIDIIYGEWIDIAPTLLSMHPRADTAQSEGHGLVCRERELKFNTLTKSYFGPAYASTIKTQRVVLSKRLMILESVTKISNVPFCDRFQVMERWVLVSQKKDEMAERKLAWLSVHTEAQFSRGCTFEHQIRTKSLATLKDIVISWCDMALQALKLTEQNKRKREREDAASPMGKLENVVSVSVKQKEDLLAHHAKNFHKMEQEIADGATIDCVEVKYSIAAGSSHSFARVVGDADDQGEGEHVEEPPSRARSFSAFRQGVLSRMKTRRSLNYR